MAYTTIDKPDEYFNTVLYTGNGSTQSITGVNFQPDWVWIKSRSTTYSHILHDVVRGATKQLKSNSADAESTDTNGLTAFNSDGFSLGSGSAVNNSSTTFVGWNWKAGGSSSSNSDGSITSNVSANTTSGFSVVSTTGTGSAATIGHGLGAVPAMIIGKRRDSGSSEWRVYNKNLTNASTILFLDSTKAEESGNSTTWNNTAPTSSVFSVGTSTDVNASSGTFIFYCFSEIKGYSKISSYTGNGATDGPFVWTGFKPAWILVKVTSTTDSWQLIDTKRDPNNFNSMNLLQPDLDQAESDSVRFDILSNGFKMRTSNVSVNSSGASYVYMAFAENPFVTSEGVPTTAR